MTTNNQDEHLEQFYPITPFNIDDISDYLPSEQVVQQAINNVENPHSVYMRKREFKRFSDWCEKVGKNAIPAEPSTVAVFALYCADDVNGKPRYKKNTLLSTLGAIAYFHKKNNCDDPTKDIMVRNTMQGLSRSVYQDEQEKQARPLTSSDMAAIRATACIPIKIGRYREDVIRARKRGYRDIALCGLLLSGGFRANEICNLQWGDLEKQDVGCYVRIKHSKTDQFGKGQGCFISDQVFEDLMNHKPADAKDEDWIFPSYLKRRQGNRLLMLE